MPGSDVALFCFIYLQPSVLAIILASIVYRGLSIAPYFNWFVGSKHRRKGVRFFECAARPRLLALFTYEVPFLTFCALFILYDADLMFFLPEVIAGEYWTVGQFYILFVCVCFFLGGLWYDLKRCGFLWEL